MDDKSTRSDLVKTPHAEREEKILAYWKENNIFEKSLEKNRDSGKEFIFYEGPPTANGHPGIHHLEARAFKDAIPRFKTMQGFYVRRKGGWDTHGLPVELQVEKELGIESKKEIENYGIAAYNEKCKESVWKYVREWEDFTHRMGYWIDLKDPYITYKSEYIESVWNIIKTVNQKNLLYKDFKVVPWCPRCGTGLSSHELGQPDAYKDVKDLAVTVKFEIRNSKFETNSKSENDKTYLLAWTTTPWTLPGNVALAVGEKIEYVKVKTIKKDDSGSEEVIILAKARAESVFKDQQYEIIEELKGSDLVGLEYEPLYPFMQDSFEAKNPEEFKKAYKVYSADFVNTEDGTGIVHTAVMYGQDDFELGTKIGLPKFHLVNDDGTFKQEAGFLAGKMVRDEATAVEIIKNLANRPEGSLLFKKEKHEHSYPHCWRCKTALIYYARDSWYIRMSALRDKLVKENKEINWEPHYIKEGRFGEWISEIKDWAISRERYWGTPLPIWLCSKCGEKKVVGAIADLPVTPKNKSGEPDLHRPYIDEVTFDCSCGGKMIRVKEVMDVWFDSGAMPFAQDHYPFENKKEIDGGFFGRHARYPADFISEAIDQTRGWFYTLHAIGVLIGKGKAYKNVVCLGHILDAQGKKMSKSVGNVVDPWLMMNKYGADCLRFWMYSVNQPGESKNFEEKTVDEINKKVFNMISNVLAFYKLYADSDRTISSSASRSSDPATSHILDQWIISRLNQLIGVVTNSLDNYKFLEPTRAIRDFVADLSQWYLRRSRDRFKEATFATATEAKEGENKQAALVTMRCLLIELSKLMAPFSPFFSEYLYKEVGGEKESVHLEDWSKGDRVDGDILTDMESVRAISSKGLEARTNAKINVRQPLSLLKVKDGRWMLKNKAHGMSLIALIQDEVNVKTVLFSKDISNDVELDINITPALKEEGDLRELLRKIQDMRKEKGFVVGERAKLVATESIKPLIEKNKEALMKAAGIDRIEYGDELEVLS